MQDIYNEKELAFCPANPLILFRVILPFSAVQVR